MLKSQNGPGSTVIDCENSVRGFHIYQGEDSLTVIDGFTVRNGFAAAGAGLDCEFTSPTIKNCILIDNFGWGGALLCNSASPKIINCTFAYNSSTYENKGAAVFCLDASEPLFQNCLFAFNSPGDAIYCQNVNPGPQLHCCNIYGNEHGDWTGCIYDQKNINGNISFDPFFCDTLMDNFNIRSASPLRPGQ